MASFYIRDIFFRYLLVLTPKKAIEMQEEKNSVERCREIIADGMYFKIKTSPGKELIISLLQMVVR